DASDAIVTATALGGEQFNKPPQLVGSGAQVAVAMVHAYHPRGSGLRTIDLDLQCLAFGSAYPEHAYGVQPFSRVRQCVRCRCEPLLLPVFNFVNRLFILLQVEDLHKGFNLTILLEPCFNSTSEDTDEVAPAVHELALTRKTARPLPSPAP